MSSKRILHFSFSFCHTIGCRTGPPLLAACVLVFSVGRFVCVRVLSLFASPEVVCAKKNVFLCRHEDICDARLAPCGAQ